MPGRQNILVIKLSALGDFIQALGPMAAIRRAHPDAHITLLTTKAFEGFSHDCGYFDEIWLDPRPKFWQLSLWGNLHRMLNSANFTRVYDLQNNDRTNFYFKLFKIGRRPEWVGTAKGASHQNTSPDRTAGHAFDGHVQTLKLAGIENVEIDTLDWMDGDLSTLAVKTPYVLLVPGSAPQHPGKRWPADKYGRLAKDLAAMGFQPVILGTEAEKDVTGEIARACPESLDLTGRTDLKQIASLAKDAAAAIGNDTGPMHLIAATACPSLVLFSAHSNPERHAPKGEEVEVIQRDDLKNLMREEVLQNFKPRENAEKFSSTLH